MLNPRIIVIGGNAAGPAAAAKAKRTNPDAEVLLFEAGEFISTGTCELPYLISGEIKSVKDLIHFSPDEFYNKKGVRVFTGNLVENVDPVKRIISVMQLRGKRQNEYKYDKLILAAGSISRDAGFKANNLFTFKNIQDTNCIREYISSNHVKRILIIGAGLIGLEAADAFHKLGMEVTLTDLADKPLPSAEKEIQEFILSKIKHKGLYFYKAGNLKPQYQNEKITSINIEGRFIETDLVISAIGFIPNTFLTKKLNLRTGDSGAVKVDRFMRTSLPDIYAAGDLIEIPEKISGRGMYIPLASSAHLTGHIAGENAAGGKMFTDNLIRNLSVRVFDQYYSVCGLTSEEANKFNIFYGEISVTDYNFNRNMPGSEKVFGKLIFNKTSKKILGASFWGGREVEGYVNLISSMILLNQGVDILSKINYTYTPPLAPMKNILSTMGWKINHRS